MAAIDKNTEVWIPMADVSDLQRGRIADLREALRFGNHKGASSQPGELLKELVTSNVVHGYALPLPLDKITCIPGVCMAPLNIHAQ